MAALTTVDQGHSTDCKPLNGDSPPSSEVQLKGMMDSSSTVIREGDTVAIYISYGSMSTITVKRGQTLNMKYGALRHEFLIGKSYGSEVEATAGYVHVLRATPELWTSSMPHRTQIIYTHDIGTIITQLNLYPGKRVCESGTGSGSMTHSLLRCVAPVGHVFTYDIDASRVEAIARDATLHGFEGMLTSSLRDVCKEGFGDDIDDSIDSIFLDLPSPWMCLPQMLRALCKTKTCRIGTFSPCVEQVSRTVKAMKENRCIHIETMEVVPRTYKTESVQLVDLLTGQPPPGSKMEPMAILSPDTQPTHTSYLTFATVLRRG